MCCMDEGDGHQGLGLMEAGREAERRLVDWVRYWQERDTRGEGE